MNLSSRIRISIGGSIAGVFVVAVVALGASPALAGPVTMANFSGPGSGDGELTAPGRAAIEASTGNVFVADGGNDRVQVFDSEGVYLTQFSAGMDGPSGLALHEAGGQTVVYVSSAANDEILKFDSDEAATPSFTAAAGFTSPAAGSAAGEIGDFASPLAVDPTTGDVLVADRGNQRVSRYGSDGAFDSSFDGADSGSAFTVLFDLAVDSTGDVLVVDSTGTPVELASQVATSRVLRFSAAGTYETDIAGSVTRPGLVAVDPDGDQVVVAGDFDSNYSALPLSVHVFASDGAPAGSGSLTGPLYGTATGLAARGGGSDRIYAITDTDVFDGTYGAVGGQIMEDVVAPAATISPATDVAEFSATLHGTVNPNGTATSYRFEYSPDSVTWFSVDPDQDGDEDAGSGTDPVAVTADLAGLTDNAFYQVRLVATNPGGTVATEDFVFFFTVDAEPPAVTAEPATDVTADGATIHGTVDAQTVSTSYRFEYSTDDGTSWTAIPVPDSDAGDAADPIDVQAEVTGIDPNTEVRYRVIATNGAGTTTSDPEQTFTTLVDVPAVVTGAATDRTTTGATLRGTVNPFGLQATYHFEYGLTTDYGSRAPLDHEAVAANGRSPRHVSQGIAGLQPGTTYHYRLVADSPAGEATGDDRTFTTAAGAETRRYELVSPAEKGGSNVDGRSGFQASSSGDGIAFQSKTVFGGEAPSNAAPVLPRYASVRGASGWTTTPLDPPQLATTNLERIAFSMTLGVSDDATKAVVVSLRKLADGAVEGDSNLYLFDVPTHNYTTMVTVPGRRFYEFATTVGPYNGAYVDGTSDFSHVVVHGQVDSLLPGAPVGATYEWFDGELRLASVAPDGSPLGETDGGGDAVRGTRNLSRISDDGSRIVVPTAGGAIYVRVDGETTVLASASHQSGDFGAPRSAAFVGASNDGRFVYMHGRDLTDDSEPSITSLYRFDVDTQELDLLTTARNAVPLQVSDDGSSAYFVSDAVLTPGASAGVANIYVWREDHLSLVATLTTLDPSAPVQYISSPNGRYLAFGAWSSLTDYDTLSSACDDFALGDPVGPDGKGVACREIYRYDAETGQLTCVSCRPDGGRPTGGANIGPAWGTVDFGGVHFPRAVLDDGRVFFDTTDPLAATDANSTRDVYEFDGDQARLISAGKGNGDSQFGDVSLDGRNVFFATQDRLVGIDKDSLADVYVARVGGGIAEQSPAPPRGTCAGEDCQGPPASPPAPPTAASVTFDGPGNVASGPTGARFSVRPVVRKAVRGSVAKLRVRVPGPGSITPSSSAIKRTHKTVAKAGTYSVTVALSARARKALKARSKLKVRVRVWFSPKGAPRMSRSVSLTFKQPQGGR